MAINETQSFNNAPDIFLQVPDDYQLFKPVDELREEQERKKDVKYDLSKVEELYGGLGIGDYADAFVGGFTDAVAATAEGLAGITGNQALTNRVARYRDHMDDAITGDVPEELKQKFSYKAVNAIGAMPAYVAMAYGTRGISLALKGLSWLGLGGNAYQQGRDDYISTIGAEGRDLTEEEFRASNSVGAKTMLPLMILERTGANTLVNSLFKGTGGTTTVGNVLKRFSKAPLAEGLTEGTQTLYQNYLANELASYDPDRPINQGVVESMLLGAIASGTYSTPANAVQMQAERLAENFDQNNINATEMADELGRSLLGTAIDDGAIPPTGADERKIIHSRGAVTKFVDDILTPLTSKLSKAGPQYKRAFRDFERQTGVQQGKAREVIEPFIQRMRNLKKISEEDYDTISDALANISIINKGNQVELDAVDSPQANEEVSTPELKENDSFVLDPTMPVGTRATETIVVDGVKTERKTRGLTEEESQGGLDAAVITEKVNKIQEQAKNAQLALSQTVPDLNIKVYHSQQEFQEATGADGDSVKGAYQDGAISINATLATENTVAHEVLHAAFLSDGKTGQEARDTAAGLLQSIARGSKDEKLMAYSKRFAESYDPSIQSEETLAEMFGVMSATYTSLDVNAKTKIKAFLAQVADAFGITGLFTEATTDKQVIDAFNTLSSSVANGTVTPEGIRIFRGSGMAGTEGSQAQQRFQANYMDPETKVRYTYFKNDEQYQRLIDNGQITKDTSFFDYNGVPMSLHVPDAMFTGQIDYKGNTIAEGRGGLNYTARFNDDNAFWASTENAANDMVKNLNNQLLEPNSDGKIRMMLLSTNLDKSTSSVDGAINSTKILGTIQNFVKSENKQEAEQVFVRAIKMAALQTEKGKQGKLNGLKQGNLFKNVKNSKQAVSVLENYLDEKNTSFDDRRSFVKFLAQRIGDQIGYTKDSVGNREFKEDYQRAMQDLLFKSSKMNQYSDIFNLGKGKTPSASSPATSMVEGLSYMLGEPLIRDYALHDQIKRGVPSIPNGSAYAVLEIEGKVKATELLNDDGTQKHNSYRFAVVSEGNKKAKIHLLRDRVRALEHYNLQGKSADSFLPPSAGFSGANYGSQQINKQGAKRFDEKKIMDPLVGRGAKLAFPEEKRQRFQLAEQGYKRARSPELKKLAAPIFEKIKNGEQVTRGESSALAEAADRVFPVKKYNSVPKPSSKADLVRGLKSNQQRLINLGRNFEDGIEVKLRLDIPAYTRHNVWAPAIHDGSKNPNDFNGGKPISHQSTAIVSSARFGVGRTDRISGQKGAAEVAAGRDKFPMATVIGSYVNASEADTMNRAKAALEDPSYIQVGMDPERRGYFYNRETMKEVIAADEVIQVGPLLMVKNPTYGRTPSNEFVSYETDMDLVAMRMQKRSDETHEQALARMLSKYNMQKDFDGVRALLNYLYTSGREAGMDVSYMEQYFPRMVKDLVGLQDEYKGVYYDNEIERELDLYAKKKFGGRELDPLERQVFLENLAKNKILKRGGAGGVTQNAVNERKIAVLDTDIRKKYYDSAESSLETYVDSMIASINQMKLIGTARKERGQRVQSGLLGRMMDADLQQGTLTAEGLNIIQDAVDARFGMNGQQHGFIRGAKNAGYIATMGNIGSAITQLGDFYFSAVQNGLVNTVQAGLAKKELNRQDIMGMKNLVTIEAQEGAKSLQKAVDFVFKASGITAIDGLAKDTNINAALRDMRKRASQSPNSRAFQKLQKELSVYQGRDSAQTIADIRNGVNSDLVLEAIYNRLSNVAPISLSEMPEAYNRNPNARIIYSLKSYTIKQFDFIRNESFNKMGSSKTFSEGFTNLLRIATLAMAANGSADVLKAILFNREIDEEDLIWNNILRMFGITKFTTVKARQEGLGEAFLQTVAPPQFGILNDFSKDFDKAITEGSFDIDELRSVKYIPFVGKLYYWREGRGKDVEKRLSRLKD